jgi:hypothetical protein
MKKFKIKKMIISQNRNTKVISHFINEIFEITCTIETVHKLVTELNEQNNDMFYYCFE